MSIELDLRGRVVLVTGASSGIGLAAACELARAGAAVAVHGRDAGRLEAAVARVGDQGVRVASVAGDLRERGVPQAIVAETVAELGRLDAVVHSAGVFEPQAFETTSAESFDRQWELNVRAPFLLTQAALPHLPAGGAVVFVSSIAGHGGFQNAVAYCATKGAVELMTRTLALELAPRGIRVNAVAPGNVRTPMNEPFRDVPGYEDAANAQTPAGRFGEPEEIASVIVFLVSEAASYVHGASWLVDGGWAAG